MVKFIDDEYFSPVARLNQVLGASHSTIFRSESNPFAELDQLHFHLHYVLPCFLPSFQGRICQITVSCSLERSAPHFFDIVIKGTNMQTLVNYTFPLPVLGFFRCSLCLLSNLVQERIGSSMLFVKASRVAPGPHTSWGLRAARSAVRHQAPAARPVGDNNPYAQAEVSITFS